jgi:hypothetical protein
MKNLFTLLFCLQFALLGLSQGKQKEIRPFENLKDIPTIDLATPNLKAIHEEDVLREKKRRVISNWCFNGIKHYDFKLWRLDHKQ